MSSLISEDYHPSRVYDYATEDVINEYADMEYRYGLTHKQVHWKMYRDKWLTNLATQESNIVCIIIPFADFGTGNRSKQLKELLDAFDSLRRFVPEGTYMFIIIAEQVSPIEYFNRGQLINAAVKYATMYTVPNFTCSSFIFHDVDIIPDRTMFMLYFAPRQSYQLVPYKSLAYELTYGGYQLKSGAAVYMTTPKAFFRANGFPNNFWGWGGEDDALHARLYRNHIRLEYNRDIGSFKSTDDERNQSANAHQSKMNHLRSTRVRNMAVYELLDADSEVGESKDNGVYQTKVEMTEKVVAVRSKMVFISLHVNLDTYFMMETQMQNATVYSEIEREMEREERERERERERRYR